jgi:hypothetical protein
MNHRREFQLSQAASDNLDRLSETYGCNFSETVEALLLGTIDSRSAARSFHRLSVEEVEIANSMGIML